MSCWRPAASCRVGPPDLLLDFGALNDLNQERRGKYMDNVLPLSHPDSRFILMCFENKLPREEVERRFGSHIDIETLSSREERLISRRIAIYWLARKHPA